MSFCHLILESYLFGFAENYGMSPNFCDKDGCTLLHWAAINNRLQVAKYLVSRQGNVNSVGGMNGEIPLQWAVRHPKGYNISVISSMLYTHTLPFFHPVE